MKHFVQAQESSGNDINTTTELHTDTCTDTRTASKEITMVNDLLFLQPKPLAQRTRRRGTLPSNEVVSVVTEPISSNQNQTTLLDTNEEIPSNCLFITTAKYEFLDHTADILVHAQGKDIESVLGSSIMAMVAYQIEHPENIALTHTCTISATGHDLISLTYNIMDAALYRLVGDNFVAGGITMNNYENNHENDDTTTSFTIQATLYGEPFLPLGKHGQGTEVKAITYSGMKVEQDETSQEFNAYIVLDI